MKMEMVVLGLREDERLGKRRLKVHLEGDEWCKANLMTNDTKLKTNCNILSVTKECSRIFSEGFWTISSKFL